MNTYQNICAYTYKLAERDRVFFMRFYWPCLWTCIMGEIFRLLGTYLFIRIYIYIHAPHSLTQSTRTHNHTHLCMHKYVFACSYVRVRGAYMCPSLACCHKLRASSDRSKAFDSMRPDISWAYYIQYTMHACKTDSGMYILYIHERFDYRSGGLLLSNRIGSSVSIALLQRNRSWKEVKGWNAKARLLCRDACGHVMECDAISHLLNGKSCDHAVQFSMTHMRACFFYPVYSY